MSLTPLRDNFDKLRILHAIGRAGSMTGAGKLLHMTQTAISHSLKGFEQALSIRLVTRAQGGVELTEAGRTLFEFSLRLFDEIDAVEKQIFTGNSGEVGTLRIGTHETLAIHVWPKLLAAFAKQHPEISASLISGRLPDLVRRLINREFHLLLTVEPIRRPELVIEKIYEGNLEVYAANDPQVYDDGPYKVLKSSVLTIEDVNSVPILTDQQSNLKEGVPITSKLIECGFTIAKTHELNSFEAAINLAGKGLGLAAIPDRNAKAAVERGVLRRIEIEGIAPESLGKYSICATYLKSDPEIQAREFFLEQLRSQIAVKPT